MTDHLKGTALVRACAAGQGVLVVVEGETAEDDQWIFTRWFGQHARSITFFAQNGWGEVLKAVSELRNQLPGRSVFGIVDRDHAEFGVVAQQWADVPSDGLWRLNRYTLENYLLEAEGWRAVVGKLTRGDPPVGWATTREVESRIDDACRCCIAVAARNLVVAEEARREPIDVLKFQHAPRDRGSVEAELAAFERRRPTPPPLPLVDRFSQHFTALEGCTLAELLERITGKAILVALTQAVCAATSRKADHDVLVSMYLDVWPDPPADALRVIEAILAAADT